MNGPFKAMFKTFLNKRSVTSGKEKLESSVCEQYISITQFFIPSLLKKVGASAAIRISWLVRFNPIHVNNKACYLRDLFLLKWPDCSKIKSHCCTTTEVEKCLLILRISSIGVLFTDLTSVSKVPVPYGSLR